MATGVNISKTVGYGVLSPPTGISISKVVAYAVLDTVTLLSVYITPYTTTISTGTQQFTCTGVYSDSTTDDLTTSVTWTSSSTGVATIGLATGLATAVSNGSTTITATSGALTATATLTVSQGSSPLNTLWTDSAGAIGGRFCNAPDGQVVYANGVDTCIWGGNEMQVGAVITSTAIVGADGSATNPKDYTEQMQNTKTDQDNIAYIGGGLDSYVKLMLHCDGTDASTTITDSSASAHTVTCVGNAQIDTASKKYGTGSLLFDGTGDYCTVPDHADWNFGTGDFSIDCWFKVNTSAIWQPICGQYQDSSNYWWLSLKITGSLYFLRFRVVVSGTTLFDNASPPITMGGDYNHLEWGRSGANVYMFHNGTSLTVDGLSITAATSMPNLTGVLEIGACYNHTYVANGAMDELRITKGAIRHTSSFAVRSYPYNSSARYLLIGSPRPLKGIKVYVNKANAVTSTMTGYCWNGSAFNSLTLTDNTDTGASLAQTGTITFSSTVDTAKPKYLEGYFLYWYQFYLNAGEAEIYHITLDAPFQPIIDLWDGVYRDLASAYKMNATAREDISLKVLKDDYDVDTPDTYADLSSMAEYNTSYLEFGFTEKQCGIHFRIPPAYTNSTAATTMSIDYWNGEDYVSVGAVSDGTSESSISFAKSGTATWNNSNLTDETKSQKLGAATIWSPLSDTSTTESIWGNLTISAQYVSTPLYWYRVRFDKAMDASVRLNYVGGITSEKDLSYFKFPVFAQGRILLCGDMSGRKNKLTCSGKYMPQVYNGVDSVDVFIGDEGELTCGTELFSQYGGNLYSLILLFKDTEFWIIAGQDIAEWGSSIFPISTSVGCPAPLTLKTITLSTEPSGGININRSLAIFQGSNGIYMTDGRAPIPIHGDIKEYFDRTDSKCIKASKVGDSVGFMDEDKQEYHWLFASGTSATTLNTELVYDIIRNKWFEIDRTSGMDLQCGVSVQDTYGNQYTYGFIDTGYIERLEYGTDFDGNDIVHTFETGDFAPLGRAYISQLDHLKILTVAKTTTTNNITCSHYTDTSSTATTHTMSPARSGYRIAKPHFDDKLQADPYHALKFTITTDNETCGFEPTALVATFHGQQED